MSPHGKHASALVVPTVAALLVAVTLLGLPAGASSPPASSIAPAIAAPSSSWAYGGNASGSFSCSSSSCLTFNLSNNTTSFALSWSFYLSWVVLVTETNVSPSQTEITTQAALNVTAHYAFSECQAPGGSGPCTSTSLSVDLAGRLVAWGATNLTNGTVDLLSGPGPSGPTAAVAVTNASGSESINVSGSATLSAANVSGHGSFALGGSSSSSISFGSPLGIVPLSPQPGDVWISNASYLGSGSYQRGYAYSLSATGYPSTSRSSSDHGAIASSGNVTVLGSDLGAATLWDNYTTPPTSFATHRIHLEFPGDEIDARDGWIFAPAGLTGDLSGSLGLGNGSTNNSSEDLYHSGGPAFVGGSLSGNASNISLAPGAPSVTVEGGPEPLAVAQQQYAAITANPAAPGFPVALVAVLAVVGVGAIGAVLFLRHRAARRPPNPPVASAPPSPPASPPAVPPAPPTGGA